MGERFFDVEGTKMSTFIYLPSTIQTRNVNHNEREGGVWGRKGDKWRVSLQGEQSQQTGRQAVYLSSKF
jgi:hypothetical protein